MWEFAARATPPLWAVVVWALPCVAWGWGCLRLAGWLRMRKGGWRVGYTRKVFHVCVFATAAVVQVVAGLPGVCTFGVFASLPIFWSVYCGKGNWNFEGIARPGDAPRRGLYVLLPWATTVAGGLFVNVFMPGGAVVGYLVAGLADAAGEPVGTRWGHHRYPVLSLGRGVRSWRSVEGSLGVFVVGVLAAGVGLWLMPGATWPVAWLCVAAVGIAAASTLVEAVTPHGWDNFTMQAAPAAMAAVVVGWVS